MKIKTKPMQYFRPLLALIAFVAFGSALAGTIGQSDLKDTKIKMSIKEGKIIEIMDEISSNTDYFFIYEDGIKPQLNQENRN
jgi:hypothetical protein